MSRLRKAIGAGAVVLTLAGNFVASWEGFSHTAYLDSVGVATICYGYTPGVKLGDAKSKDECIVLLKQELIRLDLIAAKTVPTWYDLPAHVRVALISWSYNVGETNFRNSTLVKLLKAGDVIGACNQLPRWSYAKGIKLKGLVNRRLDEQSVCLGKKEL